MATRVICDGKLGGVVTIATKGGGTGAALDSCIAGDCFTGAIVVIVQQQFALIVGSCGASCFFFAFGQQHASRIFPSMLHRKFVRANADDGRSTASISKARTTRRTAKP
jgi:hypothetical protein